jgi:hypothetical protein
MKNSFLLIVFLLANLFSMPVFSQTKDEPVSLGLPGDNLDLYAVMEIFQKSKTIEDFEKSLNAEKSGVNNLDLDNDKKVDFIKVITNKEDNDFTFILQVPVSKTENQDVAVILVSKDKSGKASIQIVGDEDMYGKNYVIEPKGTSSVGTINPGYTGADSTTMNLPAQSTTTTVVVQSPPIVQYVYSPAYVPYYPPYYYGYYPPYYHPIVPLAFGIFWANNFHHHGGYYGGYHGSVNINVNHVNHYNNYNNNSRNRSNTVANNKARGSYGNRPASGNNMNRGNTASTRQSGSASTRPSTSNRASTATRPTSPSTRQSGGSASTRPTSPSTRQSGSSASTRQSSSASTRQSSNYSRPSSSSYSGGGRSGGSFSGGGRSGGGMRGGGGRR